MSRQILGESPAKNNNNQKKLPTRKKLTWSSQSLSFHQSFNPSDAFCDAPFYDNLLVFQFSKVDINVTNPFFIFNLF